MEEHATIPRSTHLLRDLRARVEAHIGHPLTYKDLTRITGVPKSTLGNWFNGDGEPSVETLLTLWEHIPNNQRRQVLESGVFRALPTLDHPRIAHNPVAAGVLKTLMQQRKGITIVRGERDDLVTFVITALGHSRATLLQSPGAIIGIDAHAPDWFLPVPGVTYFQNQLTSEKHREAFSNSKLSFANGQTLLINGMPCLLKQATALARGNHVIFGDCSQSTYAAPKSAIPIHVVSVCQAKHPIEAIHLEILPDPFN